METEVIVEVSILIFLLTLTRILYVIHKITTGYSRKSESKRSTPCRTIICIGSGGHTTEMLNLIEKLDFSKYSPRYYLIAKSDKTSHSKVVNFENSKESDSKNHRIFMIPRSREVHQSFITSIFFTAYSTIYNIPIIFRTMPDLIICNGPGTCVPICILSFILKCFFIKEIRIVFIESYCRVRTFSLTAKILKYFADNFIVQWPELKAKLKRSEYLGQLM